MIVLGIDPGFGRCGYGVVKHFGQTDELIDYGCIETSPNNAFSDRLLQIQSQLSSLLIKFDPEIVGVEHLFFAKNTKTALQVAHARGVILLTARQSNTPVLELTPNEIKQAITGHGAADKKQIQTMVQTLLKLDHIPQPDDAADALAVALTTAVWKNF